MTYETYSGTIGTDIMTYLQGIYRKYPLENYCIARVGQYEYIVAVGSLSSSEDSVTGQNVEVYTYNTRAVSDGNYSYLAQLTYEVQSNFELTYEYGIVYSDVMQKGALVENVAKQEAYQEVACVGLLALLLYLVCWNIFKSICK